MQGVPAENLGSCYHAWWMYGRDMANAITSFDIIEGRLS